MTNQGTAAWTVWGVSVWCLWEGGIGMAGRPLSGLASVGSQLLIVLVGNSHGHGRVRIRMLLFHLWGLFAEGGWGLALISRLLKGLLCSQWFSYRRWELWVPPKIDMETSLDNVGLGSLRESLSHSPYQRERGCSIDKSTGFLLSCLVWHPATT